MHLVCSPYVLPVENVYVALPAFVPQVVPPPCFIISCFILCLQAADKFITSTVGNLSFETDANKAVTDADIVVEAIVENLGVKQKLFSALDKSAPR